MVADHGEDEEGGGGGWGSDVELDNEGNLWIKFVVHLII